MAEYIEREAVIKKFKERCTKCDARFEDPLCLQCSGRSDLETVCDLPAADVAPVVHSYWEGYSCSQYMGTDECGEPKWRDNRFYVCHNYKCRRKTVIKSNYCPNCGAKMDGGVSECD